MCSESECYYNGININAKIIWKWWNNKKLIWIFKNVVFKPKIRDLK